MITMWYSGGNRDVALFVKELLMTSGLAWPSITITRQERLGVFFVTIATTEWSVDIENLARIYSLELMNI